ncbi:MAG: hypothetical protein U1E29_04945 [Coriobacteriia bacterium]|nr:hypothetical protein [Coriobacteriia bacterium]
MRTSRFSRTSGWSLTSRRAEVMDILGRHFGQQSPEVADAEYESESYSELLAALKRALAVDDAAHEAIRPIIGKREIDELLAHRFGARDDDAEDDGQSA